MNDELSQLRSKINRIDSDLVTALAARMDIVREIGDLKRKNGLPARDNARWQEVVARAKKEAEGKGISSALIEDVFEAIHSAALEIETEGA
jgi:chorismate mutase